MLGRSSGERGGNGIRDRFGGTFSTLAPCQPAWSRIACAWGATLVAISSRWSCMLQTGRTIRFLNPSIASGSCL